MRMDKKMKGLICLLLAALCLIGLWGCVGGGEEVQLPEANPSQEDALTFPLIVSGDSPETLGEMQRQLNAYLQDKIGISIRFVPVDISTLEDFYLLQKSSAEATDFISLMPAGTQLSAMVEAGLVRPMDDLLRQYAPGAAQAAAGVLAAGQLSGVQYMLPVVKDVYTMGTSLEFNAALVKKYAFDITAVHTLADVEPMLAVIAASEPDVVPLTTYSTTGYTRPFGGIDSLGDALGVLDLQSEDALTVVDWYETERFLSLAREMRDLYCKGYIEQDAVVAQETGSGMVQSGKAFCSIATILPVGGDQGMDLDNPTGIVEIQLDSVPQYLTSYDAGLEGVCISTACRKPEMAMQFLELLYTDPYVVNLLEYGVEGTDYTLTEDGLADNGGSYFLIFGQPLNQTLRYVSRDAGADYRERCAAFTSRDIRSPALGFVFDASPVAREAALCQAAVDQYFPAIDCGCVDPDTEIPRLISALKEAGIDTIIAEKQRQLDAWVNAQRNS